MRDNASQQHHRRRALAAGVPFEKVVASEIFERDGWRCGICGEGVDRELRFPNPASAALDHVQPIERGGAHTAANVRLAHLGCNTRRSNLMRQVA